MLQKAAIGAGHLVNNRGVFYENRQAKPSFNNYPKHHEASLIAKKSKQT